MLAFYARGDAKVALPGQPVGREKRPEGSPRTAYDPDMNLGPVKRVGREFVAAVTTLDRDDKGRVSIRVVKPAQEPASETPFRVDEQANPWLAGKLAKRVREGSLWPADKHTAEFCKVPFTSLEFDDGEWIEAKPKPKPAKKSSSKFDALGADAD